MYFRFRLDIYLSSVRSSSSPPGELPAQVTRMSMAPNRSRVTSTQRWTSAITLMSPASGSTARPVSAAIFSAADSSGSAFRAVMTTSAPSRARNSATQRPMPLLAPVTKATFPSSCRSTATPSRRSAGPQDRSPSPAVSRMVYQISSLGKVGEVPQDDVLALAGGQRPQSRDERGTLEFGAALRERGEPVQQEGGCELGHSRRPVPQA